MQWYTWLIYLAPASSDFVIHVLFNALNLAKDLGSEYFPMELGCIPATHGEVMDLSSLFFFFF